MDLLVDSRPRQAPKARMTEAMFTSSSEEWGTPQDLFDALAREFGPFDLDAAASDRNAKVAKYYTKEQNSLTKPWSTRTFLNPPYGEKMPDFMAKCVGEIRNGNAKVVVCVIPCRTDTRFWHRNVMDHATEVRLIEGRLDYTLDGVAGDGATFPSAVVVFTPGGGPALVRSCDRLGRIRKPARQLVLE